MAQPIETRYCEHCKQPVERGHSVCQRCGNKLKASRSRTGCVIAVVAIVVVVFAAISIGKYISGSRYESPADTGAKASINDKQPSATPDNESGQGSASGDSGSSSNGTGG